MKNFFKTVLISLAFSYIVLVPHIPIVVPSEIIIPLLTIGGFGGQRHVEEKTEYICFG